MAFLKEFDDSFDDNDLEFNKVFDFEKSRQQELMNPQILNELKKEIIFDSTSNKNSSNFLDKIQPQTNKQSLLAINQVYTTNEYNSKKQPKTKLDFELPNLNTQPFPGYQLSSAY